MATTTTASNAPSTAGRYYVLALIAIGGIAWGTSIWWWPYARPLLGLQETAEKPAAAAKGGEPITEIQLSNEALETFDVKISTLKPSTYERIVPIPARTKAIPGRGRQEVTTSASGTIRRIFVGVGDLVSPRDPLFELQLVHDETVKTQVELLDALAEREVVSAEVTRLGTLEQRTPGAVPGTRLIEKKNEQKHLNHLIASRRQMLILLGLPESSVDELIENHLKAHDAPPGEGHDDYRNKPLVDSVTIYALPCLRVSTAKRSFWWKNCPRCSDSTSSRATRYAAWAITRDCGSKGKPSSEIWKPCEPRATTFGR